MEIVNIPPKEQNGDWTYIVPIVKLEIQLDIKEEFLINRVCFISANKLKKSYRRFKIAKSVFSDKDENLFKRFFEIPDSIYPCKTFALVKFKGIPSKCIDNLKKLIEKELNVLLCSGLGWDTRKYPLGVAQSSDTFRSVRSEVTIKNNSLTGNISNSVKYNPLPFRLNKQWKKFQSTFYFTSLLKSLYGENKIKNKNWRETIERAIVLVGQGRNSNDLAFCFLKNMIAIEMLLTDANDKYSVVLPERIEAFIGWVGYWQIDNYHEKITSLYKRRCDLVHAGNTNNIKPEDVLFSDDLLFNIIHNIIKNIKIFPSKESLILYSDKVKAEKLLGIKPKIQPKTLRFTKREYDKTDYLKISKNFY